VLVVRGDAMDHLGAALPGRKRGMTGGEIVVLGRVGDGAGRAMRRGVVAIAGDAGRGMGYSMLAGTGVALGAVGPDSGILNKRGSIIALGDIAIAPSYVLACTYQPAFLPVILRRLRREYGLAVTDEQMKGPWHRWSGDFAELGRGEILTREMT
jgi:formylmethanofuran dehydrogenase subunit C